MNNRHQLQPSDFAGDASLNDGSTRYKVGDQVFWRRDTRDDMPGEVKRVRDGKVLVRLTGRGSWTGTEKWLEPGELRTKDQQWR